jgi:hypothetical protein
MISTGDFKSYVKECWNFLTVNVRVFIGPTCPSKSQIAYPLLVGKYSL